MLYTRQAVQDNLRNREGKRVFYLGKGDQLTSDAREFLTRERIEILPAEKAKPQRFQLLGGGFTEEKPEHMTHLNAQVLVRKDHPRIRFRGMLDLLEAELLLCMEKCPSVQGQLGEILNFVRELVRCDVLEEPVGKGTLCGLTMEQLRSRSHRPQDYYGQPHFMPGAEDAPEVLLVNRVRCVARQGELAAVEAFSDREGNPTRMDILQAMNRVSSMLYLVMIGIKAGK
jgi:ethanolamine utilization cobalamin adenosyltransferase